MVRRFARPGYSKKRLPKEALERSFFEQTLFRPSSKRHDDRLRLGILGLFGNRLPAIPIWTAVIFVFEVIPEFLAYGAEAMGGALMIDPDAKWVFAKSANEIPIADHGTVSQTKFPGCPSDRQILPQKVHKASEHHKRDHQRRSIHLTLHLETPGLAMNYNSIIMLFVNTPPAPYSPL